jgi:hypothetical protein
LFSFKDKDVVTSKQGEPVHPLKEISKGKKTQEKDVPSGKKTPQNELPPTKKQPPIEFPPGKKPIPPTTPKPDADDMVNVLTLFSHVLFRYLTHCHNQHLDVYFLLSFLHYVDA